MSIFARVNNPRETEFATATLATTATDEANPPSSVASVATVSVATTANGKPDESPFVSNVSTPPPSFENFHDDQKSGIEAATQAQILSPSPAGNDISPANTDRLFVTVYTPAGLTMLVEADSPEHAVWLVRANPPPADGATTKPRPQPQLITEEIRNPGLPAGVFALAIRYCSEIYGDSVGEVRVMLDDLLAVPDAWAWWRQYLMNKLAIPAEVQCASYPLRGKYHQSRKVQEEH